MQCTHVKADGIRCGSPALRGEAFCYFHHHNADHRPRRDAKAVDIPFPEDAQCVQVGLYNVMQAVIERKIDEKRARLLIWSLQVAAAQTRTLRFDSSVHQSQLVTELPEYERVQRETSKADKEYIADAHAEVARRAAEGKGVGGGDNPTLDSRTWGTDTSCPAGKGAAPEVVDEADIAEVEMSGTGHGAVTTRGHSAVATRDGTTPAAMSREQIDRLIDRAVNGDWRSAQKLFREAGLMPAS